MDKTKKLEILQKLISLANNNPNEHEANSAARRACLMIVELNINFKVRSTTNQTNQRPSTNTPPYAGTPQEPSSYNDFASIFEEMFGKGYGRYYGGARGGGKTSQQYDEEAHQRGEEARKRAEQAAYDKQREAEREAAKKAKEDYKRQKHASNYSGDKWWYNRPPTETHIPHQEEKTVWTMHEIDNMNRDQFNAFKARKDIYFDPVTATYKKTPSAPKGHWSSIPFDFSFREGTFKKEDFQKKKEKRPINCTQCGREFMSAYIGNLFVCHECHWDNYNNAKSK